MTPSDFDAINTLKEISKKYCFNKFRDLASFHTKGRFLKKGNQKTRNVFIWSENALREEILLTFQYDEDFREYYNFWPFPLNFFD